MPRKTKPQNSATVAPGQPYGIAGEQQAAMKTIPVPDMNAPADMNAPTGMNDATAGGPPMPPMPPTEGGGGADPIMQALEAARQMAPPGPGAFSAPPPEGSQEPLMTMPPAAAQIPNEAANIIRMMAESAGGDSFLSEIADRVQSKGY